ncbi:MAG TPA: hypothetical protein VFE86_03960 [Ilumatobacteraceae bacterium]|nr:hypothetical protein [Ilumatobacteraceae bacterium]
MPLVDVTYDSKISTESLRRMSEVLPSIVAESVDCPEEPWLGPPSAGDIEIRFRSKGEFDVGELNCVIEVRTKFFASREHDKQRRVDLIRDRLSASVELSQFGVWLILSEGAWTQTDQDR